MRKELQQIAGVRKRFIETFVRFGTKQAYKGPPIKTLLFADVKDKSGKIYTERLWFTITKGFEAMDLQPGDRICFNARVKSYTKGYKGKKWDDEYGEPKPISTDYRLSHPNNIVKHVEGAQGQLF